MNKTDTTKATPQQAIAATAQEDGKAKTARVGPTIDNMDWQSGGIKLDFSTGSVRCESNVLARMRRRIIEHWRITFETYEDCRLSD